MASVMIFNIKNEEVVWDYFSPSHLLTDDIRNYLIEKVKVQLNNEFLSTKIPNSFIRIRFIKSIYHKNESASSIEFYVDEIIKNGDKEVVWKTL